MKIEIIQNQQTPRIEDVSIEIKNYIKKHETNLRIFLDFVSKQRSIGGVTCIGMAANQISINGIRFMVRAFATKDLNNDIWKIIVNPIIKEYFGIKELKAELCLTWKGKKVITERSRFVRVEYFDTAGIKYYNIYHGFKGQIWQHEIDHINGKPEKIVENNYPDPPIIKIGRNDKCPCKSGKKYKHCCLC